MSQTDFLTDEMVTQRGRQMEEQSPSLQEFDAAQAEDIEIKRQAAGVQMAASDWFAGGQRPEDPDVPKKKDVELTTSDDHLPYLQDIQPDYDLVGQFVDDDKDGTPRQPGEYSNKYVKPNRRTVMGVDLSTGVRHWNTADFSVAGVEHHVQRGVELLKESTNSAVDGTNETGIQGLSHIAQSVILQGGDFNALKNASDHLQVTDQAMALGWNAAVRAQGQQEIERDLMAPVTGEEAAAESMPPEPDIETAELINEPEWIASSRVLWEIENAAPFAGTDQELVDWGLNEMSNFNWRIIGAPGVNGTSMSYYATQAMVQSSTGGADYANSLLTLINMYDRVNTDVGVVTRSLGAALSDPLTLAGLGYGKIGAQIAARVARGRLVKFLTQAATVGAGEGASFAGGENIARQSVQKSAGVRESIDPAEAAMHAAIGAGAGMVLGPVVGSALSPHAMRMYRKGGQRMLANARASGPRSPMTAQVGAVGDLAGFVPMTGSPQWLAGMEKFGKDGMTKKARMSRAEKMGFDTGTTLYHGTGADIQAFKPSTKGKITKAKSAKGAFWLTNNPETAEGYAGLAADDSVQKLLDQSLVAERAAKWDKAHELMVEAERLDAVLEKGQNIMPVYARGKFMEFDAEGQWMQDLDESGLFKLVKKAKKEGYAGLKMLNFVDEAGYGVDRPATHYAIFDPENIRSVNAAFDPAAADIAGLLD